MPREHIGSYHSPHYRRFSRTPLLKGLHNGFVAQYDALLAIFG